MTREEAIKDIEENILPIVGGKSLRMAIDALRQPERKTGKWIPVTNGRGGFECDQCHNYAPSYQDGVEWLSGFCPNCGAEMTEGEG